MSVFKYRIRLHETTLVKDGCIIKEFDTHLPHAKEIVKTFCDRWNKDHDDFMLDLVNKEAADNRLESAYMKKCRISEDDEVCVAINFTAKKGKWLTDKIKDDIVDWMDAQIIDGWGEMMFGYNNIMTAADGTLFMVE